MSVTTVQIHRCKNEERRDQEDDKEKDKKNLQDKKDDKKEDKDSKDACKRKASCPPIMSTFSTFFSVV